MAPGEQLTLPGELTAGMIRARQPIRTPITSGPARPIIAAMRSTGMSWHRIAAQLNAARVPTPTGRGAWRSAGVMRHADPARHAAYMRGWRAGVVRRH